MVQCRSTNRDARRPRIAASVIVGGLAAAVAVVAFGLAMAAMSAPAVAVETPVALPVDFATDIQPVLAKRCFACHGPDTHEAGLRLDGRAAATAALDSGGRAIVPHDSAASLLLERVTSDDPSTRMPPEGPRLEPGQVDVLRRWIEAGAEWPAHWAFRAVVRPTVPAIAGATHPVDAFIRDGLTRRGLPVPSAAPRNVLLRRVTYDLTGLPPTEREVREFLADESPAAWERVVDRLLASPHYGERWARHWLDLVRYADTNSFERDGKKPHAWRYRDYVIRSLNDDKPYDRFVFEQLAGDELPEPSADALIATGYYRLGIWDDEPADALQAAYDAFDDIVATTAQTFLGLTINCARCHDHKIDPLTQRDYYALLAFFHNVTPMGGRQMNPAFIERVIPADGVTLEEAQHRLDELERQRAEVRANIAAIEQRIEEHGEQALDELARHDLAAWKERLAGLDAQHAQAPRALVVSEHGNQPPDTHVLPRGNPHAERRPEARVEPAFPAVLAGDPPVIAASSAAKTTGRRAALARWIIAPDNPLTARVMANRIWQHHFGRGIVRSPNNFGLAGDPPTHPELLDWLAAELVSGGWRLKPLHRLILTSEAYRATSTADPAALAADPLNDGWWRFDMRRLSAEEMRDSIHVASGAFNPKMFGPGVFPEIPQEVLAGQSVPGQGWGRSSPRQQARRSIYAHVKRSLLVPILADFDFADTDTSCPVRFTTTQPTQALGMLNGGFLHAQAKVFAERVRREVEARASDAGPSATSPAALVRRALEIALVREPRPEEIAAGVALIDTLETTDGVAPGRALELYCLTVLNLNEFAYLD
jgi:mono/diheme cytochrome c family protein